MRSAADRGRPDRRVPRRGRMAACAPARCRIAQVQRSTSSRACASASIRSRRSSACFKLVGGRVPLLLEVKVEQRHLALGAGAEARSCRLSRAVRGHELRSANAAACSRRTCPQCAAGLVIGDGLPARRRQAGAAGSPIPQFLAVDRAALGEALGGNASGGGCRSTAGRSAPPTERAQAQVHADALIWEADGRPRNLKSSRRSRRASRA